MRTVSAAPRAGLDRRTGGGLDVWTGTGHTQRDRRRGADADLLHAAADGLPPQPGLAGQPAPYQMYQCRVE